MASDVKNSKKTEVKRILADIIDFAKNNTTFKYILVRILFAFLNLFIIVSITFILLRLVPLHPPTGLTKDPEAWQIYLQRYGFDKPILVQYWKFLYNIFTSWDWGISMVYKPGAKTMDILMEFLPLTIRLNLICLIIYVPVGLTFGIIAALRKNTWIDHTISLGVMILVSIPSFVMITFLVIYMAFYWKWVPIVYPSLDASLIQTIKGMIIPVMALTLGSIAGLTRGMRAELTDVLNSDYLLLARTKGLTRRQAVIRHGLRSSMVPIVPGIIGAFVDIIFGSYTIETIYSIPGSGKVLIQSIQLADYNLTISALAFYVALGLCVNILVDISYGLVDPRIKMGARK